MKRKGFTLIELMIVVAIIGILLAMLLPRIGILIDRSREKTTGKNLKNIYTAIVQYAEREMGKFVWPGNVTEVQGALTGVQGQSAAAFDTVPSTLLRRALNITDNNTIYAVNARTWTAVGSQNLGGWCYITSSVASPTVNAGEVFINCSDFDSYGVQRYSAYPCW